MAEKKALRPLKVALVAGAQKLRTVQDELIKKGHDVTILDMTEYDLIIGPNAHRLDAVNENLLAMVIKSARARKY